MPRSIDASTVRRSARVPAWWPSATGSPRRVAHRPLPSMMIATAFGVSVGVLMRGADPTALRGGARQWPDNPTGERRAGLAPDVRGAVDARRRAGTPDVHGANSRLGSRALRPVHGQVHGAAARRPP